jgi:protein O-GlcNAcase/histone acetyltransferase
MPPRGTDKLHGVVEGFYGLPWSPAQRRTLFDWLHAHPALSTYLYAPKDDFLHRQRWRDLYDEPQAAALRDLIAACETRGLRFIYAIAPGLDICCASGADEAALFAKIDQLRRLGCRHFALLFDDIPADLDAADRDRYGSAGRAHADLANRLAQHLERHLEGEALLLCPTIYCSRQADFDLPSCRYLQDLATELAPDTAILWTGPEVISTSIDRAHAEAVRHTLRHPIILWDNLFANDYDLHRAFMGPFSGRAAALRDQFAGILLNPNCELPLNFVPLHTFAAYLQAPAPTETLQATATAAWHARFAPHLSLNDLRLLTDCFYLPHQLGPRAETLLQAAAAHDHPRLRQAREEAEAIYWHLAALEDRDLYHALRRYAWELWNALRTLTAESGNSTLQPGRRGGAFVARLLATAPDRASRPAADEVQRSTETKLG